MNKSKKAALQRQARKVLQGIIDDPSIKIEQISISNHIKEVPGEIPWINLLEPNGFSTITIDICKPTKKAKKSSVIGLKTSDK